MNDWLNQAPVDEVVLLFLAGALTRDEQNAFERKLADGWPEATAELAKSEPALKLLLESVASVTPPTHIRDRLLAKVAEPALPRGYTVLSSHESDFQPTHSPGVSIRLLHLDHARKQFSCLLRLAPGARIEPHDHEVAEECVVLEGSIRVGDRLIEAGDYQRVEAGTRHLPQWTESGALVFLTAPLELLTH